MTASNAPRSTIFFFKFAIANANLSQNIRAAACFVALNEIFFVENQIAGYTITEQNIMLWREKFTLPFNMKKSWARKKDQHLSEETFCVFVLADKSFGLARTILRDFKL